jgi:hypothetical protein
MTFLRPWSVVETDSSFLVKDGTGRTMGWFCFSEHPDPHSPIRVMTRDQAWRMAVNFARRPQMLRSADDET